MGLEGPQAPRANRHHRGATALTYGLVVGLVALAGLAAVTRIGESVDSLFTEVSSTIDGSAGGNGGSSTGPTPPYGIVSAPGGRRFADGTVATTCNAYLSASGDYAYSGEVGDGTYQIDPDGAGSLSINSVRCDMTTDGGGWTHIATISDSDTDVWSRLNPSQDAGTWDTATVIGDIASPATDADYKNDAYGAVSASQLLITEGATAGNKVLYTAQNCLSGTFQSFISALTWRAGGSATTWSTSTAHLCAYTHFGYDDPVLRASLGASGNRVAFKWGERDGVQDGNKDRAMIYVDTAARCGSTTQHVDCPTGLGGFTLIGSELTEDANECRGDSPATCTNGVQHYQLWVR